MRIAVSNPDNIGDFVLRQPLLAALSAAGHELLLIVRNVVAPIAHLAVPSATVLQFAGDPYASRFQLETPMDRQLVDSLVAFDPDLFVVAAYQHTQFEEHIAPLLPRAQFIGFDGHLFQNDAAFNITHVSQLRFSTKVVVGRDWSELRKNELLCGAVLGRSVNLPAPRLTPDDAAIAAAKDRLARLGLPDQPFWVVCAGEALAYTKIKNWPLAKWTELCNILVEKHGLNLVFIGTRGEHESTAEIRQGMGAAAEKTLDMTAEPDGLDTLLATISLSNGYLGKDTGPMHMAAALAKPVVAVFGGGHWPRFIPAALQGSVLTVRVPCTDCDWMCPYEVSHCVKDIPLDEVLRSMVAVLDGPQARMAVRVLEPGTPLAAHLVRQAAAKARATLRAVEVDRANFNQWHEDRLRDIAGLKEQIVVFEQRQQELLFEKSELAQELSNRAKLAQEANGHTAQLQQSHDDRLRDIESLKQQLAAVEQRQQELLLEKAEVATEISRLNGLAQAAEEHTAHFQAWHDDRLREIDGLKEQIRQSEKEHQQLVAHTAALADSAQKSARATAEALVRGDQYYQWHEDRKREIDALQKELEAANQQVRLAEDAAIRTEQLVQRTRELEAAVQQLQQQAEAFPAERATWDSRMDTIQRELLEARRVQEDLMRTQARTQIQLDMAQEAKSDLKVRFARIRQRWLRKLAESQGTVADLHRQLEQLRQEQDLVSASQSERERLLQTREAEFSRLTRLERELDSVRAELDAELNEKARTVFDVEHQIRRKSSDLKTALELVHGLRAEVLQSAADITALQDESERLAGEKSALQGYVSELEQLRDEHFRALDHLRNDLATSERDRADRLAVIEALSAALETSEQDGSEKQALIRTLSEDIDELRQDQGAKQALIESVSAQLTAVEKDRAEKQALIEKLSAQIKDLTGDQSSKLKLIESVSAQLTAVEKDRAEKQALIEKLSAQIKDLTGDQSSKLKLIESVSAQLTAVEKDRAEKQALIEKLSAQIKDLTGDQSGKLKLIESVSAQLAAVENDRTEKQALIEKLSAQINALTGDQSSKLKLIESVSAQLAAVEKDRTEKQTLIEKLSTQIKALTGDQSSKLKLIETVSAQLAAVEKDRTEKQTLIEKLSTQIKALTGDQSSKLKLIESVSAQLAAVEKDRTEKQTLIEKLSTQIKALTGDQSGKMKLIESVSAQLAAVEKDRADKQALIEKLSAQIKALTGDQSGKMKLIESVSAQLAAVEKDRAAKQALIEAQARREQELEQDRAARLVLIEQTNAKLAAVEQDRQDKQTLIERLSAEIDVLNDDRAARLLVIENNATHLAAIEKDRGQKQALIESLSSKLGAVEKDQAEKDSLIRKLSQQLAASEKDRSERGTQIDSLHQHIEGLRREVAELQGQLPYRVLKALRRD